MGNQSKGGVLIRNNAGAIQIAGLAAHDNSTTSAGWRDITDVLVHNNAAGVPSRLTRDFTQYEMTFSVTVGIGTVFANKAALQTAVGAIRKGMGFVAGSEAGRAFDNPNLECPASYKAIVFDVGQTTAQGNNMTMDITVRRMCSVSGNTETPIDFTGSWTDV